MGSKQRHAHTHPNTFADQHSYIDAYRTVNRHCTALHSHRYSHQHTHTRHLDAHSSRHRHLNACAHAYGQPHTVPALISGFVKSLPAVGWYIRWNIAFIDEIIFPFFAGCIPEHFIVCMWSARAGNYTSAAAFYINYLGAESISNPYAVSTIA